MLIFTLLGLLGIFWLLAIVCDAIFIPLLEQLAKRLKMSAEFAGATLLAVGSSAPELFTALFAILQEDVGAELGVGTIVGSAIFNVLVIIGATAIVSRVRVNRKPIVRDIFMYFIAVLILYFTMYDGSIKLWEAGIYIAVYILYIFLAKNRSKRLDYDDIMHEGEVQTTNKKIKYTMLQKISAKISYFLSMPALYGNVSLEKLSTARLVWGFVYSILLLAFATHFMVELGVFFALSLGVSQAIIGLTILAAGTSVPDLLGSIAVAKKGHADMAVTNAFGSNIFDILFSLGLPYFIYILWKGSDQGWMLKVDATGLDISVLMLLGSLVFITVVMIVKKRQLSKGIGYVLVSMYVLYVLFQGFLLQ